MSTLPVCAARNQAHRGLRLPLRSRLPSSCSSASRIGGDSGRSPPACNMRADGLQCATEQRRDTPVRRDA
eukprot:5339996-Prymnesium_polylepis.1